MNPAPSQSSSGRFGLMLIVTVLAVGFAIYEFAAVQRAKAALALETTSHQVDQARLQQLARRVKDADAKQAELAQALRQQGTAAAAGQAQRTQTSQPDLPGAESRGPGSAPGGGSAKIKALEDGQAFLIAYGQPAHDMLLAIGKAQVARNLAGLAASGAISPAQMDELERQTAEQWIDSLAVTPNSIHPSNPNLSDDQVKSILGEEGFQQYQNYQRMQPLQGLVNDISSLSVSAPLTAGQSSQLLSVLANASSTYASGGRANAQSVDWDQALAQAQGILSDTQIKALKAEAQLPQLMTLVKQFYQNPPGQK
jgi:hypothetical protein